MNWLDLGTLNVSTNWQAFPVAAVGGSVFRLTQVSSDFDELRMAKGGYLQVKDFYSVSAVDSNLQFARVKIGPEAKMLNWPVPQDLEAKGIVEAGFLHSPLGLFWPLSSSRVGYFSGKARAIRLTVMHDGITLALIVEFILAVGALVQGFLAYTKASERDDEQERAIGDIQTFLNSTQDFIPRKWFKK